METYKVTYQRDYPGAEDDVRECYVLANSFKEAQEKVESRYKQEYESAYVQKMEEIDADIIV